MWFLIVARLECLYFYVYIPHKFLMSLHNSYVTDFFIKVSSQILNAVQSMMWLRWPICVWNDYSIVNFIFTIRCRLLILCVLVIRPFSMCLSNARLGNFGVF